MTLEEFKRVLEQLEATQQAYLSERGRCSCCAAPGCVGDGRDFEKWFVLDHKDGCAYENAAGVLQHEIGFLEGEEADALAAEQVRKPPSQFYDPRKK